jgi:hypothetical protein
MSGKMGQFYTQALGRYKDYPYTDFHKYIVRKMENWYRMFPFPSTKNDVEEDSVSGKEGAVVDVPAVDASTFTRSYAMSDDEAGVSVS